MKTKIFYIIFIAIAAIFTACNEEKLISKSELPANSVGFIETHFAGVEITAIIKETEGFSKDYTVYLANGFDIDFVKSGDWDDVDGHLSPVPESIINLLPQNIPAYVASKFPNCTINEVNKEHYGYEIGLSNDLDLKFNSNGVFLGIDD
jgi:hypothetical protein